MRARRRDLIALINGRLSALGPAGLAPATERADTPVAPALDYSSDIKRILDSGSEGSVVGMALATALEFQIAKATHEDHPISARYIYYAARQLSGNTREDTGANLRDGVKVLTTTGAVEEAVWRYVPGQFASSPPDKIEEATSTPHLRSSEAEGTRRRQERADAERARCRGHQRVPVADHDRGLKRPECCPCPSRKSRSSAATPS